MAKQTTTSKAQWELEHAAENAVKAISNAAGEAVKAIASAAGEARSVVAGNAAEAAKLLVVKNADGSSDHDTQIKLVEAVANLDTKFSEKFADLKLDIKNLSDGTSNRISALEQEKLNTKDSYPILYKSIVEKRLDDLEKESKSQGTAITKLWSYGIALIFIVGVVEFIVSNFVK